jgi:hypothetical protein
VQELIDSYVNQELYQSSLESSVSRHPQSLFFQDGNRKGSLNWKTKTEVGREKIFKSIPGKAFSFNRGLEFAPEDFDDSSSDESNIDLSNDSESLEEVLNTEKNPTGPGQSGVPEKSMVFSLGKKTGGQQVKIDFDRPR